MILDNAVAVGAAPDAVFALLNDVERVVPCLPGASISGGDGETFHGGVKVKVGPISAAYTGTVRFLEVDKDNRRLRLEARGSDTRGSGDAEAQVELTVEETPEGSVLRLKTDLLIRGKIAQFGKGAIAAVSAKLLQQFAVNLAGLLNGDQPSVVKPVVAPGVAAVAGNPAVAQQKAEAELDGLAMLLGPSAGKYLPIAAAFAVGIFQGWLLGRVSAQAKLIKELRRG
ncbi:MAG: carbon monoxide dehydrogenase subunit [Amycolatopsis sp.]|jgi:carbon monoxide dehydrogenase subunit G|uniref:SRPBCC family protein n=1 Tax=Amycolatopsis sp. TaxID=37632 RepID=UPI002603560B|nr:SRPBCC family protein [Amycolatopsis sp.]MCU1686054.1 carbon monoxide dehydrogenase subunit [Amycolatopsis sp.]